MKRIFVSVVALMAGGIGLASAQTLPALPSLPGVPALPSIPTYNAGGSLTVPGYGTYGLLISGSGTNVPTITPIYTVPSLPALPGVPGVPGVPGLPSLPGLPI